MMRRFVLVVMSCFVVVSAQDTAKVRSNYLAVFPLSLCLGTVGAGYERVSFGRHGIFADFQYSFPLIQKGYTGSCGYRYHFRNGGSGPFVGLFFRFGLVEAKMMDASKDNYTYKLRYRMVGLNYGKRGTIFKKLRLNYTYRIGIGYPLQNTISWNPAPPDDFGGISRRGIENIIKFTSVIDGELAIIFPF
jgi:hypothetical protein